MEGRITLNVGNAVPPSLTLLSSTGVTSSQWNGVFQSVNSVLVSSFATSPPCFTVSAVPVYETTGATSRVTVTFAQFNSGAAGCVPLPTGLSGGAIAGIVIGTIIGVTLLAILVVFLVKKIDFDSKRQLFSRTKIHAAESSVPM